ncbi:MAG: general secretion pathway protein GspB [Pseudomonadota bacterium]
MSFILDALRKSEAARRRSETPDLFAAMPATPEPLRARPNWPLWLLGAVAAISLLVVLWLLAQRAPEAATASPTVVDASAETAAMDDAAVTAPAPESMTEPTPPQVRPPVDPAPAPAAAATSPSAATPPPATPLPSPPREPPAPPPDVAAAPILPPTGSVVTLADLDPATRKLLPPLKLSMHLWNETPAQRFVILDGQRLREGDLLGELVIERITRDGAVLAWRGGQLRIELR